MGIGHACSKVLSTDGFRVIGIDRTPLPPQKDVAWVPLQKGWDSDPLACGYVQLDLADRAAVQGLISSLNAAGVDRITALVNNAAIADPYMPTDDLARRLAAWDTYINTNLTGNYISLYVITVKASLRLLMDLIVRF